MQKVYLIFFAFIAAVSMGVLLVELHDTVTGQYVASGGGKWYYGNQIAQMQPDEACIYQGLEPVYPQHVVTNKYGTLESVCKDGNRLVTVPLVQTVRVFP